MSVSTAQASGDLISGAVYNALREDVLEVHDHTGSRNGTRLLHGNLLEGATLLSSLKTHAQLESDLNVLYSRAPWLKIQFGQSNWQDCETRYGSTGKHIQFSPAFANKPLIFVDWDWLLVTASSNYNLIFAKRNVDVNGFVLQPFRSDTMGTFQWGVNGVPSKTDIQINWLAIGVTG